MEFRKGDLVLCNAGREKDRLMCVTAFDEKVFTAIMKSLSYRRIR